MAYLGYNSRRLTAPGGAINTPRSLTTYRPLQEARRMADSSLPKKATIHNTGIYKITNTVNGKCYIGSASNITSRFEGHRKSLRRGNHHSRYLQRAWNKYGEDVFEFSIILYCSRKNLLFFEQRIIDIHKTVDTGIYNVCPIAGSQLGVKWSLLAKERISKARKGNITPERRLKMIEGRKGYRHSEETRKRISLANTGFKHTEESKRKMSENKKGNESWHKGKTGVYSEETLRHWSEVRKGRSAPWNLGRKLTDEQKQKISEFHTGRKHSEEVKRHLSELNKGKTLSDEHRQKISKSLKGHPGALTGIPCPEGRKQKISKTLMGHVVTEETKEKLRAAAKRQWELKRANATGD